MPYAAEMFFDPVADAQVRAFWESLGAALPDNDQGAARVPHVTLGVCEELDTAAFAREFKHFAEATFFPPLSLSHVGVFTPPEGVVFLGLTVTERLLDVHKEFHQLFAEQSESVWEYYRPGAWVPHCTLAEGLSPGQIPLAVSSLWTARLPLVAHVSALALVELPSRRVVQQVLQ